MHFTLCQRPGMFYLSLKEKCGISLSDERRALPSHALLIHLRLFRSLCCPPRGAVFHPPSLLLAATSAAPEASSAASIACSSAIDCFADSTQ